MRRRHICAGATSVPGATISWRCLRSSTARTSAARFATASVDEILEQFGRMPLFSRRAGRRRDRTSRPGPKPTSILPAPAGWSRTRRRCAPTAASVGVVGTTVLLDFLNSFMRALRQGYGTALAAESAGPGAGGFGRPEPGRPAAAPDARRPARAPAGPRARPAPCAVPRGSRSSATSTSSPRRSDRRPGRSCSSRRLAS